MIKYIFFIYILIFVSACSSNNQVVKNPITGEKKNPGIFSKDSDKGITLSDILNPSDNESSSVNVNGFLWRATLNILSIAPLISTDALGGTIITAYISTSELRSDGIEVKVHVQNFNDNFWSETFLDNKLANQIEVNILNEARNLRVNSLK